MFGLGVGWLIHGDREAMGQEWKMTNPAPLFELELPVGHEGERSSGQGEMWV